MLDTCDKVELNRGDEDHLHENDTQEVSVVEVGIPLLGPSTAVTGASSVVHSFGSGGREDQPPQ